jgi:hypothetical protein
MTFVDWDSNIVWSIADDNNGYPCLLWTGFSYATKLTDNRNGEQILKYNPNTNAYCTVEGEYGATLEQTTITVIDGIGNGSISDPVGLAASVGGAPNSGLGCSKTEEL